jgi:hypothetical protein
VLADLDVQARTRSTRVGAPDATGREKIGALGPHQPTPGTESTGRTGVIATGPALAGTTSASAAQPTKRG